MVMPILFEVESCGDDQCLVFVGHSGPGHGHDFDLLNG